MYETAARLFIITLSMLHRHETPVLRISGQNGTLMAREENRIIEVIMRCAQEGITLTIENMLEEIYMMGCKTNTSKNKSFRR